MSDNIRLVIEPIDDGIKNFIRLGRNKYSKADVPIENHIHKGSIEICYLYKGEQIFQYNNEEKYSLTGGDVFISYPDELHSSGYQPLQKSVLYWLILDISDKNNFLGYNPSESQELVTALLEMEKRYFRGSIKLKKILDEVIKLYLEKNKFYKIRVRNLMVEFLIKIIELEKLNYSNQYSNDIEQCINYIQNNVEKNLLLNDLAKIINLSLSRFKQKFKSEVGIPPNEYIQRCKIEKSKEILVGEKILTITEVALELNFCSSQYFCDTFKKYTNQTPSQYRKINCT